MTGPLYLPRDAADAWVREIEADIMSGQPLRGDYGLAREIARTSERREVRAAWHDRERARVAAEATVMHEIAVITLPPGAPRNPG